MSHLSRIVILIDMDCFYCQVEENLNKNLKGKPVAVVQYNEWRGGGIIAVNYHARDRGVTRHMRGNEAKEKCPDIQLVKVPQVRGKADLTKYRDAGARVADVLLTFTPHLERASVDEAYLDVTDLVEKRLQSECNITSNKLSNTYVVGTTTEDFINSVNYNADLNENDVKLAVGAMIAEEIREKIYNVTEYRCSAGIAHNKVLAKLVCGLHKPNKQTILPHTAVSHLYKDMPLKKIRGLGGKCGVVVSEKLKISTIGELAQFSRKEFNKLFDENLGCWLYNIARGIDTEPVKERLLSKSISCCKQFQGKASLKTQVDVEHWLHELSEEMHDRLNKDLDENNRKAKQMIVSFGYGTTNDHCSRSLPLHSYETETIYINALKIIQKNCQKPDGSFLIKYLGIGVSNFDAVNKNTDIKVFFQNMKQRNSVTKQYTKANSVEHSENVNAELEQLILEAKLLCDEDTTNSADENYLSETQIEEKNEGEKLIYFEEIHPQSIVDQSFLGVCNVADNSGDSIDQEIDFENNNSNDTKSQANVSSFFTRYYDTALCRDFNTSKCLETSKSSSDDTSAESSKQEVLKEMSESELENQTCSLCHKEIHNKDYQTHMDYHFAVELSNQEKQIHQTNVTASLTSSHSDRKDAKKSKKNAKTQKADSTPKSKSILGYFQSKTTEINEEISRTCPECNKRVLIDSFDVHMDFHIAKKIRLEDNLSHFSQAKVSKVNLVKRRKNQNGIGRFLTR